MQQLWFSDSREYYIWDYCQFFHQLISDGIGVIREIIFLHLLQISTATTNIVISAATSTISTYVIVNATKAYASTLTIITAYPIYSRS